MLSNDSTGTFSLAPAQLQAFEFLRAWIGKAPLLQLWAPSGMGKTTVLKHLQKETQGHWIDPSELIQTVAKLHPLAIEEGILHVLSFPT